MKQASKLFLTLALSALSSPAFADASQAIQSALSRLDAAEQQISSAQAQINAARNDLYSALQNNGPRYQCIFNYMGKQYRAEGATEAEAKENVIFQCSSDRGNQLPGDCRYWHNKNGNTQCRSL